MDVTKLPDLLVIHTALPPTQHRIAMQCVLNRSYTDLSSLTLGVSRTHSNVVSHSHRDHGFLMHLSQIVEGPPYWTCLTARGHHGN